MDFFHFSYKITMKILFLKIIFRLKVFLKLIFLNYVISLQYVS